MTVQRYILVFAGLFIMISLALGVEGSPLFVSKWALAFTAFVGAHSLTLTAAMSGWLSVPAAVVEPLIAASIVLMALLNLRQQGFAPRQRMALIFACGLLHGLGFAGSMADMGLHGAYRFTSVLGFNLGIELGQTLVLGAFLVVTKALKNPELPKRWRDDTARLSGVRWASVMALCAGAWWFFERLNS